MTNSDDAVTAPEIDPELKLCLTQSLQLYSVVLQDMQKVSAVLSSTEKNINFLVQQLQDNQLIAQNHDQELLALLQRANKAVLKHPLFLQRGELIKQILQLNHLLLPHINGMMTFISHELSQVRNGRAVLGGYKQTTQKHGRIVKSRV